MIANLYPHIPILSVLIPLLAGPLALIGSRPAIAFGISWIGSALSLFCSILLVFAVSDGTVISYHIGGWAPPLGIEYRIDAANALVLLIVSLISTIALPYGKKSIEREIAEKHHTLFFACYMLCFTGLMGVAATGDAFNVFVFLEISSLSTYVLVALGAQRDQRALSAAYDYLILGTIGATFFVIGLGMLYMATGTLNMVDLSNRISGIEDSSMVQSAFAFIVIGLGLKIALFPLHRWLPGAYSYAPSVVSAFLAATATKVAIYVLLRFTFSVFSPKIGFEQETIQFILLPVAVVAMFFGSIVAVFQNDFKKLLAYSSIAQIGYMILGLGFLNATGLSATLVHMFNHGISKGVLFMTVGIMVYSLGVSQIPRMAGMGRQMPWTSAAIVLGGLSLIGVPGTAGFVSKWILLLGAFEKGWWVVSILIVASSLLAVIYVWKVVETLYLKPAINEGQASEAPLIMLVPTWILLAAVVWFGINAEFLIGVSETAADALLRGNFSSGGEVIFGGEGR